MTATQTTTPSLTSSWILQVPHPVEPGAWKDAATVTVPASTRRKTALRIALSEWGERVPHEGIPCRLIRAGDAVPVLVRPKREPEQQLEIG